MGFLKPSTGGIDRVQKIENDAVLLQFRSKREMEEVLRCIADSTNSPFTVVDKWMDLIGSCPRPQWVKISGVPLHA